MNPDRNLILPLRKIRASGQRSHFKPLGSENLIFMETETMGSPYCFILFWAYASLSGILFLRPGPTPAPQRGRVSPGKVSINQNGVKITEWEGIFNSILI